MTPAKDTTTLLLESIIAQGAENGAKIDALSVRVGALEGRNIRTDGVIDGATGVTRFGGAVAVWVFGALVGLSPFVLPRMIAIATAQPAVQIAPAPRGPALPTAQSYPAP